MLSTQLVRPRDEVEESLGEIDAALRELEDAGRVVPAAFGTCAATP